MKIATRLIAIGLIMAGGVAVAQQTATNPAVVARQDDMRTLGASSKVLGDMAGGKAAFDAAKAKAALEAIVAGADKIPALFSGVKSFRRAKEPYGASGFELSEALIDHGRHGALVHLLGAENVEIA